MTVSAGIVCGSCDYLNPVNERACSQCGHDLALRATIVDEPPGEIAAASQPASAEQQEDEAMEQARHLVCGDCYTPVPSGHKFCGKCGKSLENNVLPDPKYFGDLQTPGKAKLVLIKGEGIDGMSYHLDATEHVVGRSSGAIQFAEDPWTSPVHANFLYQDGQLVVRDEGSINGVFVAVTDPVTIAPGAVFMAGEQVFRIDAVDPVNLDPEPDGTYFFASPFTNNGFKVVQILEGGIEGMVVHPKESEVTIGREGCDMNFPGDPFISGQHVKIEKTSAGLVLTDLGSKNGTFLKIDKERVLSHGDYLFLGRQLLRVEITN